MNSTPTTYIDQNQFRLNCVDTPLPFMRKSENKETLWDCWGTYPSVSPSVHSLQNMEKEKQSKK